MTPAGIPVPSLLERDLGKAPQLARMQPFSFLGLELFQRSKADLKMLADAATDGKGFFEAARRMREKQPGTMSAA